MNDKDILFIGGSGFLGSHIADKLLNDRYAMNVFYKQRSEWIRYDQEMISGDLLDQNLIFKKETIFIFTYQS